MAGAPAGYRTFAAGEVLTAANVQTYLQDQVVAVYADAAAADAALASPGEGQFRILNDSDSFQRYDGSAWVNAGGGAAGSVVQVVSTTKTDTFSTTSTSYTDVTGLSLSITPSSTSSKIMLFGSVSWAATDGDFAHIVLERGGTILGQGDTAGSRASSMSTIYASSSTSGTNFYGQPSVSLSYLDSPATTSTTEYFVQIKCLTSGTAYINRSAQDTDNASYGRSSSTFTLMEVAG